MDITRLYYLLIVTMFCVVTACSSGEDPNSEEQQIPNFVTDCGLDIELCDPFFMEPDSSNYTPIEPMECLNDLGFRSLVRDSKGYMWPICENVKKLIFADSLGNEILLDVKDKFHGLENVNSFSSTDECSDFVNASVEEVMEYTLSNEAINLKLFLTLSLGGSAPDIYDGLAIYKGAFDEDRIPYSKQVLFLFLNNRNLRKTIVRYALSREINIGGTIYNDVGYNNGRFDHPMEIYINQACGVIAFRDDSGVLWRFSGVL